MLPHMGPEFVEALRSLATNRPATDTARATSPSALACKGLDRLAPFQFLSRPTRFWPVSPGMQAARMAVLALIGAGALAGVADKQVRQTSNPYYHGPAQTEYDGVYGVLREIFRQRGEQIAAVIIEPVVGNMGCVLPAPGYLQAIRELCTKYGYERVLERTQRFRGFA